MTVPLLLTLSTVIFVYLPGKEDTVRASLGSVSEREELKGSILDVTHICT